MEVILEHPDFIVVNKDVGVPMHSTPGTNKETQFSKQDGIIKPSIPIVELIKNSLGLDKLYLVHRLDTPTSGCLILAKNTYAASQFGRLFESRAVLKFYIALGNKKPRKKQGKIIGDMEKARNGSYKLSKSKHNPAITHFISKSLEDGLRLFCVKPESGKTHQIRVALKSISSPIIGDERYKGSLSDRLYLHSHSIGFYYDSQFYLVNCLPNQGELFDKHKSFLSKLNMFDFAWPKAVLSEEQRAISKHALRLG